MLKGKRRYKGADGILCFLTSFSILVASLENDVIDQIFGTMEFFRSFLPVKLVMQKWYFCPASPQVAILLQLQTRPQMLIAR